MTAEESEEGELDDQPTNPGVRSAAEAATYLAQLRALELYRAELRREETRAARNKAVTTILKGKWGGPIVLAILSLVALVIVGLFAIAGVDVSGFAVGLADAGAHAWTGCPVERSVPVGPAPPIPSGPTE